MTAGSTNSTSVRSRRSPTSKPNSRSLHDYYRRPSEPTNAGLFGFIKATPEQVWDAIIKPEFTTRYFYGVRYESTFETGTEFTCWSGDNKGLEGEVLESNPLRLLGVSWHGLWTEEDAFEKPSRVTWEIELQDVGVTKLTVVYDQLEGAPIPAPPKNHSLTALSFPQSGQASRTNSHTTEEKAEGWNESCALR